jgi:hypothetical protein
MTRHLIDFRIENEQVILLSFGDGGSYRVSPVDLPRHLSPKDLLRVQDALSLRRHFIKRTLPPSITGLLVLLIMAFGGFDLYRMDAMMPSAQLPPVKMTATPTETSQMKHVLNGEPLDMPSTQNQGGAVPAPVGPTTSSPGSPASQTRGRMAAPVIRAVSSTGSAATEVWDDSLNSNRGPGSLESGSGESSHHLLDPVTNILK